MDWNADSVHSEIIYDVWKKNKKKHFWLSKKGKDKKIYKAEGSCDIYIKLTTIAIVQLLFFFIGYF